MNIDGKLRYFCTKYISDFERTRLGYSTLELLKWWKAKDDCYENSPRFIPEISELDALEELKYLFYMMDYGNHPQKTNTDEQPLNFLEILDLGLEI